MSGEHDDIAAATPATLTVNAQAPTSAEGGPATDAAPRTLGSGPTGGMARGKTRCGRIEAEDRGTGPNWVSGVAGPVAQLDRPLPPKAEVARSNRVWSINVFK